MQNRKISNTKNKWESSSTPPAALRSLIKSAKLLPKNLKKFEDDLLGLSLRFNAELYGAKEPLENVLPVLQQKYCQKIRAMVSPELSDQINEDLKQNSFENALMELRRPINEIITLKTVIHSFEAFKIDNNPNQTFNFDKSIAAFGFNQDTTLELASFRVLDTLTRNKIPIDRVRICPICKNIFWAKRNESPACSAPHVHRFNERERRNKIKENELNEEYATLKKLKAKHKSWKHPKVLEQLEKIKKIHNEIKRRKIKYGTL